MGTGDDTLKLNGNRADRHYLQGGSGNDTPTASGWNWFWQFDAHSFQETLSPQHAGPVD